MTDEARRPVFVVQIAGVGRTLLGGHVTISAQNYTSTGTLELWRDEGLPTPGDACRVYAGWWPAAPTIVFSGEVTTVTPEIGGKLSIQVVGYLKRTREAISVASVTDGDNPDPIATYTDQAAIDIIAAVLARYGVARFSLSGSGQHWGVVNPVSWEANATGESVIKALDEAEFYRTFDAPDGSVLRIPWHRKPGVVSRTWVQGVDIYSGRLERSNENTYNRVIATGSPQTGSTNISYVPAAERDAPSPYIPSPPTYRALPPYNSSLFEDADTCDQWCAEKLGETNRIRSRLPATRAVADPDLLPGMTVAITSAWLDTGEALRCLIEEVTHDFSQGFSTSVVLFVASEGTGWNPNQLPIAVIAEQIEGPQTLADGTLLTVVACDGGGSYDPDNNNPPFRGIVSYLWGGTAGTPSITPGSGGRLATYSIEGATAGLTITLTVTDNQGATGSATITLGTGTAPLTTRDLWSAEGTDLAFTADGGATWTDAGVAAVVIPRVAAEDFQLAATSAGALYRIVVADDLALTATLISSPTGVTALSINTFAGSSRCWAGDASGGIWQSLDSGVTWSQVGTLPNAASVKRIEESPFANGDLTALAGNIAYHSYSAGAAWDVLYTAPAGATITDFVSGFDDGFISWDGTLAVGEPSRIQERNSNVVGDWNQAGPDPVDSPGAHPVALTLGVGAPVLVAIGTAPDDTPQTWWADASGDFTFARGVYDATWGNPNDIIRDGQIDGLIYGAAANALFKTTDFFQNTAYKLKALAAGRTGYMIGYGKLRAAVVPLSLTVVSTVGSEQALNLWNGSANDAEPAGWYLAAFDDSAWIASTAQAGGTTLGPVAGSQAIWTHTTSNVFGEQSLFRRTFTVPAGTVTSATLSVKSDNYTLDVYLNGQRVGGQTPSATNGGTLLTLDVTDLLGAGQDNVLAISAREARAIGEGASLPGDTWTSYKLEIV